MPTNMVKKATNKTESQAVESVESAAVPEAAPDSVGNPESNDTNEEGKCFFSTCVLWSFFERWKRNWILMPHIIKFCEVLKLSLKLSQNIFE